MLDERFFIREPFFACTGEEGSDEDDEEVDDDSEEEEVDDSDDEVVEPPAKIAKSNGMQNGVSTKKEDKHKEGKQKKQQQQQQQTTEKTAKTLQGGVKIEDIRVGQGAVAKSGKKVQVTKRDHTPPPPSRNAFNYFVFPESKHRSTTRVASKQTTKSSIKQTPARDSNSFWAEAM